MAFDLSKYEPVADRIKKFYEKYPDGRILTTLDFATSETFERVIFKCYIHKDSSDTIHATGYAMEVEDKGNIVNKTSHVENAETSAIGRALANLGFAGAIRPSREEMQGVIAAGGEPVVETTWIDTKQKPDKETAAKLKAEGKGRWRKVDGNWIWQVPLSASIADDSFASFEIELSKCENIHDLNNLLSKVNKMTGDKSAYVKKIVEKQKQISNPQPSLPEMQDDSQTPVEMVEAMFGKEVGDGPY